MIRSRLACLVLAALLAGSATPCPADEGTQRLSPESRKRARGLYEKGVAAYERGDLDEALSAFELAFEISKAPALLFNIAQVHRNKGDCAAALRYYNQNLELAPNAPNRKEIESYVEAMKQCGAPATTEETPETQVSEPETPDVAAKPTPRPSPSSGNAKLLWVSGASVAAAGVVLVAVGAGLAVAAALAADDLSNQYQMPRAWTADAAGQDSSGHTNAVGAAISLAVGGVALAGGATLFYFGWKRAHRESAPRVSAVPLPEGGALWTAAGRF